MMLVIQIAAGVVLAHSALLGINLATSLLVRWANTRKLAKVQSKLIEHVKRQAVQPEPEQEAQQ